jgi:ketosteroid isomerase-like protein
VESESGVQYLIDQFYAAYTQVVNGDPEPMLALWSHAPYVSAMHTLGDTEVGWEKVEAEWRRVSGTITRGEIAFELLQEHGSGDLALVVGIESGAIEVNEQVVEFRIRVTNIFELQDGQWRVIHHHGDAIPAMEKQST